MPVQIGQVESGFANPLGLLRDCHRRIERFLDTLLRVAELRGGGALEPGERSALEGALNYFRDAAPKHTADEEDSLFPRLVGHAPTLDPQALAIIAELEAEHESAGSAHEDVDRLGRAWLACGELSGEESERLLNLLRCLRGFYRRHIETEDNELFPLAGRVLDAGELAEVGREMRARRG